MLALGKLRAHRRNNTKSSQDITFERAKNLATIVSALAIPIVLSVVGYFVQRELSNEGLKKDYVGIAASILKEDATRQEPELRAWAAKVLEDNSPVPFTQKVKQSLVSGTLAGGPAWVGPPTSCRKPAPKRTVYAELHKLSNDIEHLDVKEGLSRMQKFIDSIIAQELAVSEALANFECLRRWVDEEEQADITYRNRIGAPSSASVIQELKRQNAAATRNSQNSTR